MGYARNLIVVVPAVALAAASVRGEGTTAVMPDWNRCVNYSEETGKRQIDPVCFFEALIARYRCLEAYEDIAKVIQVTERLGEPPLRVETLIGCEIEGDRLLIETSSSQIRRTVGLNVRYRKSPAIEAAELSYNLWLAPHMALRFAEEPQREFRPGVKEGFTPIEAESVTIDEKPMVHLQLKSGDGQAEACESQFDLYVNPDSMLVERITGQERLPGGASYETTLEITPISAQNADVPSQPLGLAPGPSTDPRAVEGAPGVAPDSPKVPVGPPVPADPPLQIPPSPIGSNDAPEVPATATDAPMGVPPGLADDPKAPVGPTNPAFKASPKPAESGEAPVKADDPPSRQESEEPTEPDPEPDPLPPPGDPSPGPLPPTGCTVSIG